VNTMQKVTAAVFLLGVAGLLAAAAIGTDYGADFAILAVAAALTGAFLIAAFARGDVIARLQKGVVVLALVAAVFTVAVAPLNRMIPGWRRRLAQYPELRGRAHALARFPADTAALDATDSVIAGHLLSDKPELWRKYGSCIVSCARRYGVPVESIAAVVRRETLALLRSPVGFHVAVADTGKLVEHTAARPQQPSVKYSPAMIAAARAELARRREMDVLSQPRYSLYAPWRRKASAFSGFAMPDSARVARTAQKYDITEDEVVTRLLIRDSAVVRKAELLDVSPAEVVDMTLRLDSLLNERFEMASAALRELDEHLAAGGILAPNWTARLALACSELLVGCAAVVVLGLLRRKPRLPSS